MCIFFTKVKAMQDLLEHCVKLVVRFLCIHCTYLCVGLKLMLIIAGVFLRSQDKEPNTEVANRKENIIVACLHTLVAS